MGNDFDADTRALNLRRAIEFSGATINASRERGGRRAEISRMRARGAPIAFENVTRRQSRKMPAQSELDFQ